MKERRGLREITLADLTPRQRQVVELMRQRLPYAEIAVELARTGDGKLSLRTVQSHVRQIADRLPCNGLPAGRRIRQWVERLRRDAAG